MNKLEDLALCYRHDLQLGHYNIHIREHMGDIAADAYRAGFRSARELAVKAAEDRAREDMLHWDEITGGNGWRMVVCTSRMIANDIRKLGEDDANTDDNGFRIDGN